MEVSFIKHINNKKNRIEFWLTNFDYIDGSDYLSNIFCEKYAMKAEEKLDGIWFSIIKLYSDDNIYELLWDEDIGNVVYSVKQDEVSISELEVRLNNVLNELNDKINSANQK